ncbi:hypothetical protein J8F10_14845 [Gemmata sp. G18]|uniref:2'-5' RNA ligase family protein n=1 Tax=Gemmata palustris TaxID=2822762 RepID=A0ABS5BTD2_9BACT|nr:hypothetical protein [Gemmata palustris]MBP3956555.1 hypothetical protein [Gemmata palustris]
MRSIGTYRFSPEVRTGSHGRRDGGSTRWWLIIDCDPDLGRYLRHLFTVGHYRTRSLQQPLWGPHISVIRGNEPPDPAAWGQLDGAAVEFEYDSVVRETGGFVWCPVECPEALAVRETLGLPRCPDPPLHLTIGNFNYGASGRAEPDAAPDPAT